MMSNYQRDYQDYSKNIINSKFDNKNSVPDEKSNLSSSMRNYNLPDTKGTPKNNDKNDNPYYYKSNIGTNFPSSSGILSNEFNKKNTINTTNTSNNTSNNTNTNNVYPNRNNTNNVDLSRSYNPSISNPINNNNNNKYGSNNYNSNYSTDKQDKIENKVRTTGNTENTRNTGRNTGDIDQKVDKNFSSSHQEFIWNKLVGLENIGNTCFMSTGLQCLIHSRSFMRYFLNEFEKDVLPDFEKISFQLYVLLTNIIETPDGQSVSMEEFKDRISEKLGKYGGFSHHDSQEFLRCLLEELNTDLNYAKIKKFVPFSSKETDMRKFNCDYNKHFQSSEDSIIVDFFYGQIWNCFTCDSCWTTINTCEKFMDIPISLPADSYLGFDLVKILDEYFLKKEEVELAECGGKNKRCKSKLYKKESRVTMLPEILIISFQRYNLRYKSKNNSKIKIYEDLDMSRMIDKTKLVVKTETKYKLYAISHHKGDLDFGHYWAQCKVKKKWYDFNDSRVKEVPELNLNTETVYALFYEKVDKDS